jgi:hypothetical protein
MCSAALQEEGVGVPLLPSHRGSCPFDGSAGNLDYRGWSLQDVTKLKHASGIKRLASFTADLQSSGRYPTS